MNRILKTTYSILAVLLVVGTNSLYSATLYWAGGTTDIADGTPLPTVLTNLTGVWNSTTKNWATDSSGTTYTNWTSGSDMIPSFGSSITSITGGSYATVDLGQDVELNSIDVDWNVNSYHYGMIFDASTAKTITFTGSSPNIVVAAGHYSRRIRFETNVELASSEGLAISGGGEVEIESDSSGLVGVLDSSILNFIVDAGSGGDITGISKINLSDGSMQVDAKSGANDALGDGCVIRLTDSCPKLLYRSYASSSSPSTEYIDSIDLDSFGEIGLEDTAAYSSGDNGELILTNATAGISRGADGKGTMLVTCNTDDSFDSDLVIQNGYAADTRLPWAASTTGSGILINSEKKLEVVPWVSAPVDVSTWSADQTYVIEGTTALSGEVGNITIKSLGDVRSLSDTLTIGDGNTLTLSEGQLIRMNSSGAKKLTIDGGKLTSGNGELYVFTGNRAYYNDMDIKSEITGDIDLILCGDSVIKLMGTNDNTYTGATYINGSADVDAESTDNTLVIPGDLVIGSGATFIQNGDNLLNTNANLTIRENGEYELHDSDTQLFKGIVTIDGGTFHYRYSDSGTDDRATFAHEGSAGLVFNGGLVRAYRADNSPRLIILTDVEMDADASLQSVFSSLRYESGYDHFIELSTAESGDTSCTWDVADSISLDADTPEMLVEMPFGGYIEFTNPLVTNSVDLTKTGTGTMQLDASSYKLAGSVNVNNGELISNGEFLRHVIMEGTLASGSAVVTGLETTEGLQVGQIVYATVSAYNATITSIDSDTQVTLNKTSWFTGTWDLVFFGSSGVGTSSVNVNNGGTFGGTSAAGSIAVASGGVLSPGAINHHVGTMTNETVVVNVGGEINIDLSSFGNDKLLSMGDLTINGNISVALADGYYPDDDSEWTIAQTEYGTIDISSATVDPGYGIKTSDGGSEVILYNKLQGTIFIIK